MYFKTIKSVLNVYHLYLKLYDKTFNMLKNISKQKINKKYSPNKKFNWKLTILKKAKGKGLKMSCRGKLP